MRVAGGGSQYTMPASRQNAYLWRMKGQSDDFCQAQVAITVIPWASSGIPDIKAQTQICGK